MTEGQLKMGNIYCKVTQLGVGLRLEKRDVLG